MIIFFKQEVTSNSKEVEDIQVYLSKFPNIKLKFIEMQGETRPLLELHLIGATHDVPLEVIETFPGVERAVRVSSKYRQIGRHKQDIAPIGFTYNGLKFDQETMHIFAGPCAVDTFENTEDLFKLLKDTGIKTARMGAYKPRTSPYDFQGHGAKCLPWVFELAGKYDVKAISMEVLKESHIEEINNELEMAGNPTGVILQIGTRNAQNFELLKAVGSQTKFPVLYKRGMGLTLEESLNACEYIASEGNRNIIFCLRGVKSQLGLPHRNLVDFSHVPVLKRLTRLPVCIDPSHSVGTKEMSTDGILDIFHVTAQGVIAGANIILVEVHPNPATALCDAHQALLPEEFRIFIQDVQIARDAYEKRLSVISQKK